MDMIIKAPTADEIGKHIALAASSASRIECTVRHSSEGYILQVVTLDEDEPPT